MIGKKTLTFLQWAILPLAIIVPVTGIAILVFMGIEPSLYIIGSVLLSAVTVGLAIVGILGTKKAEHAIEEQKVRAAQLASKKDYGGAISIWKELLHNVEEQHVKEVLPQLGNAYQEMESSEGKTLLAELQTFYDDFFDMTKRLKQADAKGRAMRQSLAEKICETVSRLPES